MQKLAIHLQHYKRKQVAKLGAGWYLHFYASPIVNGTFNSKQMWNRTALIKLHDSLAKHLQEQGFSIARGEANTGKAYTESYKDFKRERSKAADDIQTVDKALELVKANAVKHDSRAGVLGFGAREASVELSLPAYNALLRLAEQGQQVTLELAENRKRIDQSRKLQQAEKEKAILWSKADKASEEIDRLKQQLVEMPAKVIKEYEHRNKDTIILGRAVRDAINSDKEFYSNFSLLYKEHKKRMQAQAKEKQISRDRNRGGRDDY